MTESTVRRETVTAAGKDFITDEAASKHSQGMWLTNVDDIDYQTGTTPEDSAVIHAAAAALSGIDVLMEQALDNQQRWLMLFDATVLPANGTAPKRRYYIPGVPGTVKTAQLIVEPFRRIPFSIGIVAAISETENTLTVATGTEAFFQAQGKIG